MTEPHISPKLQAAWRRVMDLLTSLGTQVVGLLRQHTHRTREQVQQLFYSTSDQVLERAEETRRAVRLRMAIMEIEHHLNRLYPQIGKQACDLMADGRGNPAEDEAWRGKVELAEEYRTRLRTLRAELEAQAEPSPAGSED